jgi:hypothetical protein
MQRCRGRKRTLYSPPLKARVAFHILLTIGYMGIVTKVIQTANGNLA